MDFFRNNSSRIHNRLYQQTLWAFSLILLIAGTAKAQSAPSNYPNPQTGYPNTTSGYPNTQSPTSQSPSTYPTTNPYNFPQNPSTVPIVGQSEIDISSPRVQDRTQTRLASPPLAPAPPTEFQRVVAVSAGRIMPIFGAGIFNSTPSTFAPVDNIPVTPNYVIGPGDELRLQIWGQVNQRGTFVVDRTGSISLPEVGAIHVAGLQFSQLSDFLKSQLGRVYRNFDLNINLGQLRSIQVFVVGQARQPGSYTIGSLSTLLNALFASGGPLPNGSLRDIQVKRGSETITHFDLYDLLLRGDKSKDVRLEPGDVIFIPDVGPQVAVLGSVSNPGIYELRGEKTFNQVIALSGGLTNVAADSRLRVERIYNHNGRSMAEIDLASGDSTPVQDGDIVNIDSIVNRFQDAVTLRGNVANPGRYVWRQGMHVSDVIPNREALITRSYYQGLNQLGQTKPEFSGPLPDSNYGNPAPGSFTPTRTPDSTYTNPNTSTSTNNTNRTADSDYNGARTQGALGLVSAPAGDAAVARGTAGTTSNGGNSLGATLTGGANNFAAKNDVVLSAPEIDWEYAVIERQSATDLTTSLLPFNLGKAVLDKDPSQNLELLAGDVVTIFSKADIRVPSSQQTNESVRKLQRQRLLDYADLLDSQITASTSAAASSALTSNDTAAAQASAAAARGAVTRLRQAQPTGRIVLALNPGSNGVDAVPDIQLEDGDRFIVPRTPSTIGVQGQVYSANAFLYEKGKRVKDYLHLAGGPDRLADRRREFVLRADGSVLSRQSSSLGHRALFASADFDHELIFPGDTIVVPPVIEKGALMREILNISTIVQGFGLGVAAINVLK